MAKITSIEGIGPASATKLKEAGILTTEQLLSACADPKGRKELAAVTDLGNANILKWANRADLARVKGIGEEYADLLEAAGVDTVPALARRNANNLHQALSDANQEKNLVRRLPALSRVEDWINQAKALPRLLNY